jgi:site-specific DNA-adenine methylase
MTGTVDSRVTLYNYLNEPRPWELDPLERAYRYYYINLYSFSGLNKTFHGISGWKDNTSVVDLAFERPTDKGSHYREFIYRDPYTQFAQLRRFQERWHHVQINNQDFRKIIPDLDGVSTLVYEDPPYFHGGSEYAGMYGNPPDMEPWTDDFQYKLADINKNMQGKFLLSIDSCPEAMECYVEGTGFHYYVFDAVYCGGGSTGTKKEKKVGKEMLVWNYEKTMGERRY